jgi:hypothetical protein
MGRRTVWLAFAPAAIFLVVFLLNPLRFPAPEWPAFFMDDFCYYVVIARHIVASGLSSFDGQVITNGYHPLWMCVLIGLTAATGGPGTAFYLAVIALQIAASLAATWLVLRILRRHAAPPCAITASVMVFAVALSDLVTTGMEVVIAIPLLLAFLDEADLWAVCRRKRPLRLGLLGAAAILARVDAAILVALVLAMLLAAIPPRGSRGAWLRTAFRLAAGLLPCLAYAGFNLAEFGTALPISSTAKALAPGLFVNRQALFYALATGIFDPMEIAVLRVPAWISLALALTGTIRWRSDRAPARLATLICGFPVLYYGILAIRSDWVLWSWYLYPVVIAAPFGIAAAIGFLTRLAPRARFLRAAWFGLVLGAVPAGIDLAAHLLHTTPAANQMYQTAAAARPFLAAHPGYYAMGDRAGVTALVMTSPVLQLEGIVGDRQVLRDIASRTDLLAFLRKHRADYYIGTNMPVSGACRLGIEPKAAEAGPLSPAMTGRFCGPYLFRYHDRFGTETLIFRVPQA